MILKLVGGPADGQTFDSKGKVVFEVPYPLQPAYVQRSPLPGGPGFDTALYEVKRVICEDKAEVFFAIPRETTVKAALLHLLSNHQVGDELDIQGSCEWEEDADGSAWETSCRNRFLLNDGGPVDNGLKFCPFCGKEVDA